MSKFPKFATLLRREWMQHHRGYLVLMAVPPVILLLVLGFADAAHVQPHDPVLAMAASTAGVSFMVLGIAWIAMAFQLPGLARRDQQDRSIEFWRSMPVSHSASIGATVLMHTVLFQLLALGLGFAASQVVGLFAAARVGGVEALWTMPWATLVPAALMGLLRVAVGLCLATLWVSPFLMLGMLSSALFKRWGAPALIGGLFFGHLILAKVYGITVVGDTVNAVFRHAGWALLHMPELPTDAQIDIGKHGERAWMALDALPAWAVRDIGRALVDLFNPLFAAALVVSGACFTALVEVRRRAG